MSPRAVIAVTLMFAACGEDALKSGIDAVDTARPDFDARADGVEPDSRVEPDTSVEPDTIDTSAADTIEPDTIEPDTSIAPDTIEADTIEADTIEPDTSIVPDTTEPDTSVAPDTTEPETTAPDTTDTTDVSTGPEPLPELDPRTIYGAPYLNWVTQTEVSVRWESKSPVVGRVDFGPSDALGTTLVEPEARTTHELRLTGLAPNALNSYRVVSGGAALPIRHFHTAPPDDSVAPFEFIVWGDNQDGPDVFADLTAIMAEHDARFAVSVGDCVQNGTRGEYRDQLFSPMTAFADEVPFLVAEGNHERYGDSNASLFDEYLSQPGNEHCFGWRYGGLFILFIDTELELDGPQGQRECVNAQLQSEAARTAKLRAAAFHKPPRVEWWFGGLLAFPDSMEAPWVREQLEPLLEAYDVNVVFNGHNHLYAYTPETPGGITWVTTGGGGGKIDERGLFDIWRVGTWPQIETTIHAFHFLLARMDDDVLTVDAIDRDGEVMHSFVVSPD